ncbi:MAG TPA: MaoC family dehydratase [Reyranellaceae bacterium]|nr:MaoC family dehydratase [Reyranellaceae bacterium]
MNAIVSPERLIAPRITDRFSVTAEDMEGFAVLSGDRSAVHGAADFARRLGLEGRVVYEGLIVARLSRLVSQTVPGLAGGLWGGLRIDFHHPLYVGEPAVMTLLADEAMSTSGVARFDFRIEASGRLIADGVIDTLSRPA